MPSDKSPEKLVKNTLQVGGIPLRALLPVGSTVPHHALAVGGKHAQLGPEVRDSFFPHPMVVTYLRAMLGMFL